MRFSSVSKQSALINTSFENISDNKPLMKYGSTDMMMMEPRHTVRPRLGSLKEEESSELSDASAKSALDRRRVS